LIVPSGLWAGLLLWLPQSLAHDPLAFRYIDPSHLWSNCAEHWTISDIGAKLPLCPSQDARWANVRGYQEEWGSLDRTRALFRPRRGYDLRTRQPGVRVRAAVHLAPKL